IDALDGERAHASATLHQGDNRCFLFDVAALAVRGLAADKSFVNLNDHVIAAELAGEGAILHRFANAMQKEPRGLVRDSKGPVYLMGADALLARTDEIDGLQHEAERHAAMFEHRANLH